MQYKTFLRNVVVVALCLFAQAANGQPRPNYDLEIRKAAIGSLEKRISVKTSSYLEMLQQLYYNLDGLGTKYIKGRMHEDFFRKGESYMVGAVRGKCTAQTNSLRLLKEAMEEEEKIPSKERKRRLQIMHDSVMAAAYRAEKCVEEENKMLRAMVEESNELLGYQVRA